MKPLIISLIFLLISCNQPNSKNHVGTNDQPEIIEQIKDLRLAFEEGDYVCLNFASIGYTNSEIDIKDLSIKKLDTNINNSCKFTGRLDFKDRSISDVVVKQNSPEILMPFRDKYDESSLWLFWEFTHESNLIFKDYLKSQIDGKASEILKWDLIQINDINYLAYIKYWGDEGSHNQTFYLNKITRDRRLEVIYKKTIGFEWNSKNRINLSYQIDNSIIVITETVYMDILTSNNEIKEIRTEELDIVNMKETIENERQ